MKNDYLDKAIAFATTKHSGQKRKDGSDYISHPLRVASYLKDKGYDQDYYLAGLFHDLLEDTDATEDEIFELSNQKVLDAVKLVTKSSFVPKDEYIKRILENQIAKEVKAADRLDNLRDALDGKPEFIKRYLENTKKYYLGKFGEEVDQAYYALLDKYKHG